jgi:aminoglycoside phosphotransferase (APT) family kinase protein
VSAPTTVPTPTDAERSAAALATMREAGAVGDDATVTVLRQLHGGWSRHSYVMDVRDPDRGDLACIVRVRPSGAVLDTDLEMEHRTFAVLEPLPLPTPAVLGLQPDGDNVFGGPFFVMGRLSGESPNVWNVRERRALEADWAGDRGIAEGLVQHLATIHGVAGAAAEAIVPARSFGETVEHWRSIWEEQRLVRDPVVDEAFHWVASRPPGPVEPRLVHGDYRVGNCLVDGGRISGILDWELAHVGDPRFDLGYLALPYSSGKLVGPGSPLLGGVAEREWFFARYAELTGAEVDLEAVRTFSVLSALMLAAITATGIRVYRDGGSADVRMLWSRFMMPGLRQDVAGLMEW